MARVVARMVVVTVLDPVKAVVVEMVVAGMEIVELMMRVVVVVVGMVAEKVLLVVGREGLVGTLGGAGGGRYRRLEPARAARRLDLKVEAAEGHPPSTTRRSGPEVAAATAALPFATAAVPGEGVVGGEGPRDAPVRPSAVAAVP
jgi:hypothetical protein